jgi:hypothetical protein
LVPHPQTFKIVKGKNDDDIKILGGTIQFDGDVEDFQTRKKHLQILLISKTDNFDIEYNTQSKLSKAIFLSK